MSEPASYLTEPLTGPDDDGKLFPIIMLEEPGTVVFAPGALSIGAMAPGLEIGNPPLCGP